MIAAFQKIYIVEYKLSHVDVVHTPLDGILGFCEDKYV